MPATIRVQVDAALLAARPDLAADAFWRPSGRVQAPVRRLLGRAVRAALRDQRCGAAEISIALVDDAAIAALNEEYLSHEGETDVISFGLYEAGELPVGDIYIGAEQALRQAESNGVTAAEELVRLAVHGVLHVLGHDHAEGAERTQSEMWAVQERVVASVMQE
jgi:probable rRNA maturation factor